MAEIPTPDLAVPYLNTSWSADHRVKEVEYRVSQQSDLRGTDAGEDDGGGTAHSSEEGGVDGTQLGGGRHGGC